MGRAELPTDNQCFSLRGAARFLRVRLGQVSAWVRSGELAAANLAGPGQRPRYRIAPAALEAFLAARSVRRPPRRRRASGIDPEVARLLGGA